MLPSRSSALIALFALIMMTMTPSTMSVDVGNHEMWSDKIDPKDCAKDGFVCLGVDGRFFLPSIDTTNGCLRESIGTDHNCTYLIVGRRDGNFIDWQLVVKANKDYKETMVKVGPKPVPNEDFNNIVFMYTIWNKNRGFNVEPDYGTGIKLSTDRTDKVIRPLQDANDFTKMGMRASFSAPATYFTSRTFVDYVDEASGKRLINKVDMVKTSFYLYMKIEPPRRRPEVVWHLVSFNKDGAGKPPPPTPLPVPKQTPRPTPRPKPTPKKTPRPTPRRTTTTTTRRPVPPVVVAVPAVSQRPPPVVIIPVTTTPTTTTTTLEPVNSVVTDEPVNGDVTDDPDVIVITDPDEPVTDTASVAGVQLLSVVMIFVPILLL